TAFSIRESRGSGAARLDVPGLVASAIALFALTYALIEGNDKGWTSGLIVASFVVAAGAAAAFVLIEGRSQNPMISLPLFRSAAFSGGTVTMMLWAFGVFGIYFFTSLYLQDILGFSPTKAGLAFVPMAVCIAVAAVLAQPVSARLRPYRTVALGMLIMAGGLVLFARLGQGASFASLMPGFLIFGAGAGLMQVPLTNAVMHAMPPGRSGVASAVFNASREVAGLLGITIIGAILRSRQGDALHHGPGAGLPGRVPRRPDRHHRPGRRRRRGQLPVPAPGPGPDHHAARRAARHHARARRDQHHRRAPGARRPALTAPLIGKSSAIYADGFPRCRAGGGGVRGFATVEFQLMLLRRMADYQPELVRQATAELGRPRSAVAEAHHRWQTMIRSRTFPVGLDRLRIVLRSE